MKKILSQHRIEYKDVVEFQGVDYVREEVHISGIIPCDIIYWKKYNVSEEDYVTIWDTELTSKLEASFQSISNTMEPIKYIKKMDI